MRRKRWLLVSATVCALPMLAIGARAAHADTLTGIPQLTSFHQMAVATSAGYIFMSGSTSSGSAIVVTDLDGNYVTALDTGDGVEGIALSSDGTTLYAALTAGADANSIAAITVSTITATTTPTQAFYPLGTTDVPYSLAVQSKKLWVSYEDSSNSEVAIGDIDLSTNTFEPATAQGTWSSPPDLAADPSDTGVLVAVGGAPATAATFNTQNDPATQLSQGPLGPAGSVCSNENQLAVVPGGADFVAACDSPANESIYSTSNVSGTPVGQYDTGSSTPGGVAMDADGLVAVGTYSTNGSSSDIYVYNSESDGTPLIAFTPSSLNSLVNANGLAWEDTTAGPQLAALVAQGSGSATSYSLDVFGPTTSSLDLDGPSSAYAGKIVMLRGTLTFGTGTVPAGTQLTVARTVSGSTGTTQFTVPTGPGGTFSLADTPPGTGTYTYSASYAGSLMAGTAGMSRQVSVVRGPASLTLTTGGITFDYESTIHVTAHLGTTYQNRTVSIYAQWFGSKGKRLLKAGRVNSSGDLTVTYRAPYSTEFSAVFGGDAEYLPKSVARLAYVRARVSESISGYYASRHIGRLLYRLFRTSGLLNAAAGVAPDKHGECVQFQVQEYFRGTWHSNVISPCVSLTRSSRAVQPFGLTQADVGYPYRIRAEYIRSATDKTNLSADSSWLYLMVET